MQISARAMHALRLRVSCVLDTGHSWVGAVQIHAAPRSLVMRGLSSLPRSISSRLSRIILLFTVAALLGGAQ